MNTPFLQVHVNKSVCDRFSATWSLNRGHHLFIYQRSRSQATVTSDVIERFRQSINNDADIFTIVTVIKLMRVLLMIIVKTMKGMKRMKVRVI